MTARQPRRRRRAVPAAALPRPTGTTVADDVDAGTPEPATETARGPRRRAPIRREHHVTTDYSYVRKDLVVISVISAISLGFVLGMSFLV